MKRPLLLLTAVLVLAAGVLWIATRPTAAVPGSVAPPELSGASAIDETRAPAPLESPREEPVSSSEPAPTARQLVQDLPEAAAASPTPTGNVAMAKLRGSVVRLSTREPVTSGTVSITTVSDSGPAANRQAPAERPALRADRAAASIDSRGRFELELPVGTQLESVDVSPLPEHVQGKRTETNAAGRFAPTSLALHKKLDPTGREVLVEVDDGLDLEGDVRDAESNAPIEGARVSYSAIGVLATTSKDGSFAVGAVPFYGRASPRKDLLLVEHPAYTPTNVPLDLTTFRRDPRPIHVLLRRGIHVSGRLVDERRTPVVGALLTLRARGAQTITGPLQAGTLVTSTSRDDGSFRFPVVLACESAVIDLDAQDRGNGGFLGLRRELGALRYDLDGLELVVSASATVRVLVQRADGKQVPAKDFQVIDERDASSCAIRISEDGLARIVRVPLGRDLHLAAYARSRDASNKGGFERATKTLRFDAVPANPEDVLLVLAEQGSFKPPPAPRGAKELELPSYDFLRSTLDVQLVDARTGRPLANDQHVQISCAGASLTTAGLTDGWLRLRGTPGAYEAEVEVDGSNSETQAFVLPASGYASREWRMKVGR